jgi:hypothetical protein
MSIVRSRSTIRLAVLALTLALVPGAVFAASGCGVSRTVQEMTDLSSVIIAFPNCTTITSKTNCEDTTCAQHGLKCNWDATRSDKCKCDAAVIQPTPGPIDDPEEPIGWEHTSILLVVPHQ